MRSRDAGGSNVPNFSRMTGQVTLVNALGTQDEDDYGWKRDLTN